MICAGRSSCNARAQPPRKPRGVVPAHANIRLLPESRRAVPPGGNHLPGASNHERFRMRSTPVFLLASLWALALASSADFALFYTGTTPAKCIQKRILQPATLEGRATGLQVILGEVDYFLRVGSRRLWLENSPARPLVVYEGSRRVSVLSSYGDDAAINDAPLKVLFFAGISDILFPTCLQFFDMAMTMYDGDVEEALNALLAIPGDRCGISELAVALVRPGEERLGAPVNAESFGLDATMEKDLGRAMLTKLYSLISNTR